MRLLKANGSTDRETAFSSTDSRFQKTIASQMTNSLTGKDRESGSSTYARRPRKDVRASLPTSRRVSPSTVCRTVVRPKSDPDRSPYRLPSTFSTNDRLNTLGLDASASTRRSAARMNGPPPAPPCTCPAPHAVPTQTEHCHDETEIRAVASSTKALFRRIPGAPCDQAAFPAYNQTVNPYSKPVCLTRTPNP